MKKLVLSILVSLPVCLACAPSASAEEFSVTTTVAFESRYVFRGIQFAETSFQPGIDLSYGNFYGGAWLNLPVGDDDFIATPGGEELDLFAGYSASLDGVTSFDIGVTYYTFPDLMSGFFDIFEEDGDGLGANTLEIFGGISFDTVLSPSFYIYRDFMFDTTTFEGGVSHSYPISENTSFDFGGAVGYVIDDDAGADYLYGAASADVSYAFTDNASASVGARYGGSDIAGGSLIDDSIAGTTKSSGFWFGLSLSSSF
ncbi:MAG: hypothetical protein HKN14_09225 [Marinicaulis sp.]|nr:hypothetical protein [Marinicaulis sp.]